MHYQCTPNFFASILVELCCTDSLTIMLAACNNQSLLIIFLRLQEIIPLYWEEGWSTVKSTSPSGYGESTWISEEFLLQPALFGSLWEQNMVFPKDYSSTISLRSENQYASPYNQFLGSPVVWNLIFLLRIIHLFFLAFSWLRKSITRILPF